MSRPEARIAASAGLIVMCLAVGGPAAGVAAADPGRSGSGHSRGDGHNGSGNRGHDRDGRDGRDGRDQRGGHDDRQQNNRQGDNARVGNGRDDDRRVDRDDRDGNGRYQGGSARSGSEWDDDQSPTWSRTDSGSESLTIAEAPTLSTARSSVSATTIESDGGGGATPSPDGLPGVASPGAPGGGGAGPGAARAAAAMSPPVTVGNGRSPGLLSGRDDPRVTGSGPAFIPSPELAPSTVVPAPVAPQAPPPIQPAAERHPFIEAIPAPLQPAFPGGLLFGIAGLVLMPLAGVWVGYRQARATRAASQLIEP